MTTSHLFKFTFECELYAALCRNCLLLQKKGKVVSFFFVAGRRGKERPLTTTEQIKEENPRVMENWKASLQTRRVIRLLHHF